MYRPTAGRRAAGVVVRRMSRLLPPDVRAHAISAAPGDFDARFSALWRRYSYRVCDDPAAADPLRRHDTLCHARPLDLGRMNEAAAACIGEHDFAAFCRRRCGATTVRELIRLTWASAGPAGGRRDRRCRCVLPQHGAVADRRAAGGRRRDQAARLAGRRAGRRGPRPGRARAAAAWPLPGRDRLPGRRATLPTGPRRPAGSGPPPAATSAARAARSRRLRRRTSHQPLAQAHIRRVREQQGAELLELMLLRCRLRGMQVGELGPDQDQVVALDLGFLDAGALGEVAGGPLRAA